MTTGQASAGPLTHLGDAVVHGVRSVLAPAHAPANDMVAPASGWLVVTVLRDASEVDTADLPAPLAEYGDRIDVRVRSAADDKGTELAARLRSQPSASTVTRLTGQDPQGELRSALRRAKQLIEVGEILTVDPAPHGDRPATPQGALLEAWTRVAHKAGVR